MDNVDTGSGTADGHIDENVTSEEQALELIKKYNNSKVAYFWHRDSGKLIEKPPSKRTGKWSSNKGVYFIYANKVLSDENSCDIN